MRCVFGFHMTYKFCSGRALVSTLLRLVSTHCPKTAQKVSGAYSVDVTWSANAFLFLGLRGLTAFGVMPWVAIAMPRSVATCSLSRRADLSRLGAPLFKTEAGAPFPPSLPFLPLLPSSSSSSELSLLRWFLGIFEGLVVGSDAPFVQAA
ncbi:hypothetical protein Taro_027049 [Colocasia esculenta]|uniref:Uncharacterized protein n=1 Tax=Colocasia esculenta TaxID=4460 RepID=A0A843VDI3_COLES|nr:hypothetical protein [Colocasia esculenta]